ncbi:hypothetical protein QAD02_003437 [Eretmocerus hayati]|uniref:Uncharacterized protein n=1 Tax=Eretmocerus hayati TaxID=131215 RepID=A0ACC2NMS8_9HYME|nr:hypothetical protein QAD02_003437 [Eretmocerus hayati]
MSSADDEIIREIQLGRTKIGYTVLYGIALYCESQLIQDLKSCGFLSIAFDESLNKVVKKSQMDIHVKYWNERTNQAETRYYDSCFLGHTRSCDLLSALVKCISALDRDDILQFEMDGPHFNCKFYDEYKADHPGLLELGSCGLHVVHGAFKDGMVATKWDLVNYSRSLYYLFRDYPARRAIYIHYSGSETFPQKFCGVRWVENIGVMERAIEVDSSVRST